MTVTAQDGKLTFNAKTGRWEDEDGNIGWEHKRVCSQCGKPRLDLNGVSDCDFCLQALTSCDFIDNACCGHGVDKNAYISLKDGRRFVLDTVNKEVVNKLNELSEENEQLRTQLLICQQSKNDDVRIKVWQVPPIPKGTRITISTTSDGETDE